MNGKIVPFFSPTIFTGVLKQKNGFHLKSHFNIFLKSIVIPLQKTRNNMYIVLEYIS